MTVDLIETQPSGTYETLTYPLDGNRKATPAMNKLNQLRLVWALLVAFPIVNLSTAALGAAARPNVLFVICDDLNNHIGSAGYPSIQTPSLDRFAQESLTFRRAYCQYPVCGPSRASLLSGLYPESTGVLDNTTDIRSIHPNLKPLPQLFKDAGYWTASVGKVFHSPRHQPGNSSWHEQLRFENDELPLVVRAREQFESEHGPISQRPNRQRWKQHLKTLATQTRGQTPPGYGPTSLRDDQHKDGKNARQVVRWLNEDRFDDKPFFIACGIQKPHVPFLAPQPYFDLYPIDRLPGDNTPDTDWEDVPPMALVKRFTAFGFEEGHRNETLRRSYIQAYHACISFIDAQIGLILDSLRQSAHWENTIVIVTSDHGYHLGEHFLWGKVSLFEECARVPLIIRVPKLTPKNQTTQALVELIDLAPTLLDLCQLKTNQSLQGRSFRSVLTGETHHHRSSAYTVVSRGKTLGRSIRTQRWRYAEWGSPENAELYDLENDPGEFENLIARPDLSSVRETLRESLAEANTRSTPQN